MQLKCETYDQVTSLTLTLSLTLSPTVTGIFVCKWFEVPSCYQCPLSAIGNTGAL